jgi:NAD(P)H-flavin reductase
VQGNDQKCSLPRLVLEDKQGMPIARMQIDHLINAGSACNDQDAKEMKSALLTVMRAVRAMYKIVHKEMLAPYIVFMGFEAPKIARSAHAGQYVIIRADETGAYANDDSGLGQRRRKNGHSLFILGTSTSKLASLMEGESVINKACPLGGLQKLRCSARLSALATALESAPFCRLQKLSKRR